MYDIPFPLADISSSICVHPQYTKHLRSEDGSATDLKRQQTNENMDITAKKEKSKNKIFVYVF